jgi:Fic family protein
MLKKLDNKEVKEFLIESNAIEEVYHDVALLDAFVAWKYIYSIGKLTLQNILKVHELLMKNQNPRIAGKVRTCDVWIGGERKVFFSEDLIKESIVAWIKMYNISKLKTKNDKSSRIQELHILFEDIHPFEDGNGRVGRILYNWQRVKNNLPLHVIHTGEEQFEYYNWFRKNDKIIAKTSEIKKNKKEEKKRKAKMDTKK